MWKESTRWQWYNRTEGPQVDHQVHTAQVAAEAQRESVSQRVQKQVKKTMDNREYQRREKKQFGDSFYLTCSAQSKWKKKEAIEAGSYRHPSGEWKWNTFAPYEEHIKSWEQYGHMGPLWRY